METLVYIANVLYLASYFVQDMLRLRVLTVFAAACLIGYFYLQPAPMMTVVYWNLFFVALNIVQIGRIVATGRTGRGAVAEVIEAAGREPDPPACAGRRQANRASRYIHKIFRFSPSVGRRTALF